MLSGLFRRRVLELHRHYLFVVLWKNQRLLSLNVLVYYFYTVSQLFRSSLRYTLLVLPCRLTVWILLRVSRLVFVRRSKSMHRAVGINAVFAMVVLMRLGWCGFALSSISCSIKNKLLLVRLLHKSMRAVHLNIRVLLLKTLISIPLNKDLSILYFYRGAKDRWVSAHLYFYLVNHCFQVSWFLFGEDALWPTRYVWSLDESDGGILLSRISSHSNIISTIISIT